MLYVKNGGGFSNFSSSWTAVTADTKVLTHVLLNWIQISQVRRHFQISNRKDVNCIIKAVSMHLSQLESNSSRQMQGFPSESIRSKTLCKLLTRSKKLEISNLGKNEICLCSECVYFFKGVQHLVILSFLFTTFFS